MKWAKKNKGNNTDGKVVTGNGTSKLKSLVRSKRVLAVFGLILLVLIAAGAYWFVIREDMVSEEQDIVTIENNRTTYSDQQERIQKKFDSQLKELKAQRPDGVGKDYMAVYDELRSSDPTGWDKAMVDKAHFSLQYADITDSFLQVNTLLSLISVAESNDVNVNKNRYNMGEKERKAIQKRANTSAKEVTNEESADEIL